MPGSISDPKSCQDRKIHTPYRNWTKISVVHRLHEERRSALLELLGVHVPLYTHSLQQDSDAGVPAQHPTPMFLLSIVLEIMLVVLVITSAYSMLV